MIESDTGLIVIGCGRFDKLIIRQCAWSHRQIWKRIVFLQDELSCRAKPALWNDISGKWIANDFTWICRVRPAGGGIEKLILIVGTAQAVDTSLRTKERREISLPHGLGRNAGEITAALARSESFPVNREPGIIFPVEVGQPHRAAEIHSVLILSVGRLLLVKKFRASNLSLREELP